MSLPEPKQGEKNLLITSALPYVNNVPHLGNLIGCVLSADVYARFARLRGYNVLYVCGTDEYGTATETKAIAEGVTPREICDKYHKLHSQTYEWFDISFDIFGRTSTPAQTEIAQDIFLKNQANELIFEDETEQLYCLACSKFLADRFVLGTCPDCAYDDARGDQCDRCGHLLNAIDLKLPRCATDGSKPIKKTSKHLFMDLPKLSDALNTFIEEHNEKGDWSSNAVKISQGWIKNGLKPRCITRDLSWGTPVPKQGYEHKVFYVWFDAPIGYISITASKESNWEKWWKNENVELVQFMGKDNIPFHTIMFPAALIGAKDGYILPSRLSTTEYLNYESGKFSKSMGVGVFGDSVQESGVPSEVWRYYLLANRPEQSDSSFLWSDFQAKTNDELLKNLGNFVQRALKICKSNFGGRVPSINMFDEAQELVDQVSAKLKEYIELLDEIKIKSALKTFMAISSLGNQFLQHQQPWELMKNPSTKEKAGTVVAICINLVYLLATCADPFMPAFTTKVLQQLNADKENMSLKNCEFKMILKEGHAIGEPIALFAKIDNENISDLRGKYSNCNASKSEGEEFPLKIVVGKIEQVDAHASAEHLYVLSVDVGESSPRTIVSGLANFYSREELVGKYIPVLINLKASAFRGVKSFGMILCASADGKTEVLEINSIQDGIIGLDVLPDGFVAVSPKEDLLNAKKLKTVLTKLNLNLNSERSLQSNDNVMKALECQFIPKSLDCKASVH